VGSGTGFEDRGSVELRGVPGTWQLLTVDRHGPRPGSAEAQLVSTPTPGPRTAMPPLGPRRGGDGQALSGGQTFLGTRNRPHPRNGMRAARITLDVVAPLL